MCRQLKSGDENAGEVCPFQRKRVENREIYGARKKNPTLRTHTLTKAWEKENNFDWRQVTSCYVISTTLIHVSRLHSDLRESRRP